MYYTGIINKKQGKTMNKIKLIAGSLLLSSTLLVSGCMVDLDDKMMRAKGYDCHQIAEIERILNFYAMKHTKENNLRAKDPHGNSDGDCWSNQGCVDLYYTVQSENYPLDVYKMYDQGYTIEQIEEAQKSLDDLIVEYGNVGILQGPFKTPPLSDLSGAYKSILNHGYNYDEPACPDAE
jgi:hypothetical protein